MIKVVQDGNVVSEALLDPVASEETSQPNVAWQGFQVLSEADELCIDDLGPKKAAMNLAASFESEEIRAVWYQEARIRAIIGSCPRSLESAKSGMRAYVDFCRRVLKKTGSIFPPVLGDLLAWSRVFRHPITFSNYLGYVKLACEILDVDTAVFQHCSVRRAKIAVDKRGAFTPREPLFIRRELVAGMILHTQDVEGRKDIVMLCLFAYLFLLRVPSEGIPVAFHEAPDDVPCPVLRMSDDHITLDLPRRKNKNRPSKIVRTCWCSDSPFICPVHILGGYVNEFEPGSQPFSKWSCGSKLAEMRDLLTEMGVEQAALYRSHDLRRGHTEDLRAHGASLGEILLAGG